MSDMAQTDMPGTALTMGTCMTAHTSTNRGGYAHLSGGQSQTMIGTEAAEERTGIATATGTGPVSMTDGSMVMMVHCQIQRGYRHAITLMVRMVTRQVMAKGVIGRLALSMGCLGERLLQRSFKLTTGASSWLT